ncbi:hypothetical protein GCM10010513_46010 [Streptomyces glebosus]|nr:hypothetical protein GCM10010513_46010 [Streptomyces glebosus]
MRRPECATRPQSPDRRATGGMTPILGPRAPTAAPLNCTFSALNGLRGSASRRFTTARCAVMASLSSALSTAGTLPPV